jgi:hypothetical protein
VREHNTISSLTDLADADSHSFTIVPVVVVHLLSRPMPLDDGQLISRLEDALGFFCLPRLVS